MHSIISRSERTNAAVTGYVRSIFVAGSISDPMYFACTSKSARSNAASASGERIQSTSVSSVARM
ncbi:MAG: hypothetical protein EBZ74_00830 [Planctomycetia bacterium]|nr:hypothetical protein [Planctomycetia bacterium]